MKIFQDGNCQDDSVSQPDTVISRCDEGLQSYSICKQGNHVTYPEEIEGRTQEPVNELTINYTVTTERHFLLFSENNLTLGHSPKHQFLANNHSWRLGEKL